MPGYRGKPVSSKVRMAVSSNLKHIRLIVAIFKFSLPQGTGPRPSPALNTRAGIWGGEGLEHSLRCSVRLAFDLETVGIEQSCSRLILIRAFMQLLYFCPPDCKVKFDNDPAFHGNREREAKK